MKEMVARVMNTWQLGILSNSLSSFHVDTTTIARMKSVRIRLSSIPTITKFRILIAIWAKGNNILRSHKYFICFADFRNF